MGGMDGLLVIAFRLAEGSRRAREGRPLPQDATKVTASFLGALASWHLGFLPPRKKRKSRLNLIQSERCGHEVHCIRWSWSTCDIDDHDVPGFRLTSVQIECQG
jgi:hypothetical protein